jgi:alpha-L-fucosidase
LWPSAYTNYNISKTPFNRDVVGELATACKQYGIKFCIYYTVLDWHHPDYPLHNDGNKIPDSNADMPRFVLYMKNQLKELINNYHPYMLWFDGYWETPWTQEMAVDMYTYIKKLDPSVIINNRLGKTDHRWITSETVGDYATPEQEIGKINMKDPWESCITLCHQWAWKPNDDMKSLSRCITTLSRTAAGNGNLLLNVGPMPDGRMEQRQIQRLKEMGDWLKINGEAIYGTKGGPYKPDSIFSSTRKGQKLFLHLYASNNGSLTIPAVPGKKIQKAYFLGGTAVGFKEEGNKFEFTWTGNMPNAICSILVLEMDGNMETVPLF